MLFERYSDNQKISEKLVVKYISDIVLALHCIHSFKLVHCDLKPSNLIFESDAPDSHIKLIDFGGQILQKSRTFYTDSVHYMAPEYINGAATTKSDIWSAGIVLYTMLSGSLPYEHDNNEKTVSLILEKHPNYTAPCWKSVSPEAKALVQKMLSKNQKDRPTAEQILSDPWILSYNRSQISDTIFDKEIIDNIIHFNAKMNLEKVIFSFIANQVLGSKDLKKLKEMFKGLDKDGSGTLSVSELNAGYDILGVPPPSSIIEIMKKLDTDDSGSIDYYEFLKGSEDWSKVIMKKELNFAVKKYEKGFDAKLSLVELKSTIPDIEGTEWYQWLGAADKNGDGFITLEELKDYLFAKLGI